jgi:hypothetical protein
MRFFRQKRLETRMDIARSGFAHFAQTLNRPVLVLRYFNE